MTKMGLFKFLQETEYCDFNNPTIKKLAAELTASAKSEKEKATILFYWVRDAILYRVGFWNRKASETLEERKGGCTSKANLLVALLRAVNIPAGYGVMRVKGKEYFGPIVPSFLKQCISDESVHCYVCVNLSGKWIKCDASDDKEFAGKTSYFNPPSELVNWDGETDMVINIAPEHILKDDSPLDNIDHMIAKKPQTATKVIADMGNLYIEFLRNNDKRIDHTDELEPLFKAWIKKNHLPFYCLFCLATFWRGIASVLGVNPFLIWGGRNKIKG